MPGARPGRLVQGAAARAATSLAAANGPAIGLESKTELADARPSAPVAVQSLSEKNKRAEKTRSQRGHEE